MYNFTGIKPEAIELLSINRFNDSKSFYEEHKEEIKQGATIPMRQIVLDLSEDICEIEPLADTNPNYVVSRIRRDTRRSKSKLMYRENLWLMLRRNKFQYPFAPFFWFEFHSMGYCFGLGMWTGKPAQFDYVRQIIMENPDKWLKAVKTAEKAGLVYGVRDFYKKDKIPDAPENLKKYTNAKNMEFSKWSSNIENIAKPELIDELKSYIKALTPIYEMLIEAYDRAFNEGMINTDVYRR